MPLMLVACSLIIHIRGWNTDQKPWNLYTGTGRAVVIHLNIMRNHLFMIDYWSMRLI